MPFFAGPLSGALARARLQQRQGQQEVYQRQQEERQYQDNALMRELALQNQQAQTRSMQELRDWQIAQGKRQAEAEQAKAQADQQAFEETVAALEAKGIPNARAVARNPTLVREYLAPAKPETPRNIDPLSPEGIAAAANKARTLGPIEAQFRPNAQQQQQGRPLSANMASDLGRLASIMRTAEDAVSALDAATAAGKNVTGVLRGPLTGTIGQALGIGRDPLEVSARGALANLSSQLMKERSGGAITPQEFVRLEPFLPSKNEPEEVARQKLVDLHRNLSILRDERLGAMQGSGYDVSGVRGAFQPRQDFGQGSGKPDHPVSGQAPPVDPDEAWAQDYLRRKRGTP